MAAACISDIVETLSTAFFLLLSLPAVIVNLFFCLFKREADLCTTLCREDPKYFEGKVAWITGASSGIGESLAELLASRGACVILSSRTETELKRVGTKCRNAASAAGYEEVAKSGILELVMDVGDLASLEAKAAAAIQFKGSLDFLFNNAGVGQMTILNDFATDEKLMRVNFTAPAKLAKLVLPHFKEKNSGHFVNTSSIATLLYACGLHTYSTSKAALLRYFEGLHDELRLKGYDGIHVTTVLPGTINTNFVDKVNEGAQGSLTSGHIQHMKEMFTKGLSSTRCANMMLRAVAARRPSCWIANQGELFLVTLMFYFPQFSSLVSRNLYVMKAVAAHVGLTLSPSPEK